MTDEPYCDPFWRVVDAAAFIAAIDRDLGDRQRSFAEKIRKGAMHQAEADHVIGLIRDMRADLSHYFGPVAEDERRAPREDPAFTWADKVAWIRREHGELEENAGELVSKGRLTIDDAKRLRAMFGTLHRLYWRGMFMWQPPAGPAADYLHAIRAAALAGGLAYRGSSDLYWSAGAKALRQLVRDHMALLEAESGQAQGELAA